MLNFLSSSGTQKKILVSFLILFIISIFIVVCVVIILDKRETYLNGAIKICKLLGHNLKKIKSEVAEYNKYDELKSKISEWKDIIEYYNLKITFYDMNWGYLWGDKPRPIYEGFPKISDLREINIFNGAGGFSAKEVIIPIISEKNNKNGILALGIPEFEFFNHTFQILCRIALGIGLVFIAFYFFLNFYINKPLYDLLEIIERNYSNYTMNNIEFVSNVDEYNRIYDFIFSLQHNLQSKLKEFEFKAMLLDEKIQQLWEIYGFTKEIGLNLDLNSILNRFVEKAKVLSHSSSAKIYLIDTKIERNRLDFEKYNNFFTSECLKDCDDYMEIVNSAINLYETIERIYESKTLLVLPLISNNKIQGVLTLCKNSNTGYSESIKWFLETISPLAASLIENAKLYQNVLQMKNYIKNVIESLESGIVTVNLDFTVVTCNSAFLKILNIKFQISDLESVNLIDFANKNFDSEFCNKFVELVKKSHSFYNQNNLDDSNIKSSGYNINNQTQNEFKTHFQNKRFLLEYDLNLSKINYSFIESGKKISKVLIVKVLPLIAQSNCLDGLIVIIDDITNLDQYEKKIYQTEKLALVGKLSASVAHEIRNPLVAIRGIAEYLLDEVRSFENSQTIIENIKVIINEVDRINKVVQQLLNITKDNRLNLSFVKLKEILNEVLLLVRVQANKKNIQINLHMEEENLELMVDIEKIKQILLNVLFNAIQAIDKANGVILISVRKPISEDNLIFENLVTSKDADYVVISITDNGCGISEEYMDKVFDPFFSSSVTGTGLGLTITKNLVEQHNGKIAIESLLNLGTTVKILLPKYQSLK